MGVCKGQNRSLKLDAITLDPRLQCRASLDMPTIDDYAEVVKSGEHFAGELPRVYEDTVHNVYWLAGGWHRHYAHRKAGKSSMECYVVSGGFLDALKFAVGDNATHGRPRTGEDKRRAVVACLENEDLQELSTREIADMCKVSRDLVERVRTAIQKDQPATRVGKNGQRQAAHKPAGGRSATRESEPAPDLPAEIAEPVGEVPVTSVEAKDHTDLVDAKGRPVPDGPLVEVFADRKWFTSTVQDLGELASRANGMRSEGFGGAFLSVQSVQIAVQNLQAAISSARPYVVCPACSGTLKEAGLEHAPECKLCRADGKPQGWLPAGKYQALTQEQKAIAEGFKKGDAWEGESA